MDNHCRLNVHEVKTKEMVEPVLCKLGNKHGSKIDIHENLQVNNAPTADINFHDNLLNLTLVLVYNLAMVIHVHCLLFPVYL